MKRRALQVLLLCALTLGSYGLAPTCGFVWDDHDDIERGRLIGSLRNLPKLFLHDTMYNTDGGAASVGRPIDTYRPLTMATFFVERAAFGLRPAFYHADSVLIHLANAGLVYALGLELGLVEGAALLAAALFAVHPAPSEAVYWVNGRSDPLCLLLYLLAVLLWLRGLRPVGRPAGRLALGRARGLWVGALFFCATLCKETAFLLLAPLAVLLPALDLSRRQAARAALPWCLGAAAGMGLRLLVLRRMAVGLGGQHLLYALRRAPDVLLDGLLSLVVPTAQIQPSLYEHYRTVAPLHTAAAVVALGGLLALSAWRWRRGDPLAALAAAVFLCTLGPISMLTFIHNWSGWGRYLYAASAWAALALAYGGYERLGAALPVALRRAPLMAGTTLVLVLAAQTFAAGWAWRDERSLIMTQIVDFPQAAMGYSNLSVLEMDAGKQQQAVALLERAALLAPEEVIHWSRLAEALRRSGRGAEAFGAAQRVLAMPGGAGDNNARFIVALGLAQAQPQRAARLLLDVLRDEPDQDGVWYSLGQALLHGGPEGALGQAVRELAREQRYQAIADRVRRLLGSVGVK